MYVQVARWSFPEDLSHVYAIANLSQREGSWSRAELMANDGCIRDMWQVGQCLMLFGSH